MVFSYDDLRRVCNLGDVAGLCGANCYHSYYAFIPGISTRTYTDTQLEEMNAREKETHTYQGKQYNAYEATQRQRQLETRMRAQRSKIKLLKEGKADPDEIMAAQTRYLSTLHEYQGLSKAMKLPEQMERVYMDGLGRIINARNPGVNPAKGGILKTVETIHKSVGAKSRNYDVFNPKTGEVTHLAEGTRITQPKNHIMAGKGRERQIDCIDWLNAKYPGSDPSEWTKEKGFGYILDEYGEEHKVELHWYQNPKIGKVEMKLKEQRGGGFYIDED